MKYSSVASALLLLASLTALVHGAPAAAERVEHIATRSEPQPIARPVSVPPTRVVQKKREDPAQNGSPTIEGQGNDHQPGPTPTPKSSAEGVAVPVARRNDKVVAMTAGAPGSQPTPTKMC